jgi:hypothetical protein
MGSGCSGVVHLHIGLGNRVFLLSMCTCGHVLVACVGLWCG